MIVYSSRTGNNRHIVDQLGLEYVEVKDGLSIDSPFFILTYTDGLGQVPEKVYRFMLDNYGYCRGIIASGNSNFGINNFCGSADKLSQEFNIPIIRKIELRGFKEDYQVIISEYNKLIGDD